MTDDVRLTVCKAVHTMNARYGTDVLNKGYVILEKTCASDLDVVNAARVSFNKYHSDMEDGDDKLIGYLMKNRHGTPFEHNLFRFLVKAPLFVFREWHRHRIGVSINEWSARYSELEPDFYYPYAESVRTQTGKPGHYEYVQAEAGVADYFVRKLMQKSEEAYAEYQAMLNHGIAKEQARLFLPVNIYSVMYWTCNARSLMNFLSLRNHEKAQWEIQQYAKALEQAFSYVMPITHKYFIENGRVAP